MSVPEVQARLANLSLHGSSYSAGASVNYTPKPANQARSQPLVLPAGKELTVRYLTDDDKRKINNAIALKEQAEKMRAEAFVEIEQAQKGIAEARAIQEKAKAAADEARAIQEKAKAAADEARAIQEKAKAAADEARVNKETALAASAQARTQIDTTEASLKENIQKRDAEMAKMAQMLQTLQTKIQSLRPLNQNDAAALAKLDSLAKSVEGLRGNIPADASTRNTAFKKLQAETQLVLTSVKAK